MSCSTGMNNIIIINQFIVYIENERKVFRFGIYFEFYKKYPKLKNEKKTHSTKENVSYTFHKENLFLSKQIGKQC